MPKNQERNAIHTRFKQLILPFCVLVVVLFGGGLIAVHYNNMSDPMAHTQAVHLKDVPVSTAAFTQYQDSAYNYTISYPSDWEVKNTGFSEGSEYVYFHYQVSTPPDVMALQVVCSPNPKGLTAQQWSEQDPSLHSDGYQTLGQGVTAFVAHGAVDVKFTTYTIVNGNNVCVLTADETNAANKPLLSKVIHSFFFQK